MDINDTLNLILNIATEYGTKLILILSYVILIGLGYLVFNFGWDQVQKVLYTNLSDRSMKIGGFYLWKTPYKGYNRFRSQKWNTEHTM